MVTALERVRQLYKHAAATNNFAPQLLITLSWRWSHFCKMTPQQQKRSHMGLTDQSHASETIQEHNNLATICVCVVFVFRSGEKNMKGVNLLGV